jgi:hypothetical protein
MRQPLLLSLTVALFSLAACGPRVTISPGIKPDRIRVLAIAPVSQETDLQQERLHYLQSLLHSALSAKSYHVIIPEAVDNICGNTGCADGEDLRQKLGADAVVRLSVSSFAETNFLGGYFSRLSAVLTLEQQKQGIITIDHAVSDRGGIIFNAGQVLKGLQSQYERFQDSGFERLANRLVSEVVQKVPTPQSNSDLSGVAAETLVIQQPLIKERKPNGVEVCFQGNPQRFASLFISSRRLPLREITLGRYCGVIREDAREEPAFVELKNVFGISARRDIDFSSMDECSIAPYLKVERLQGSGVQLSALERPVTCEPIQLVILRASDKRSRPQQVAVVSSSKWIDNSVTENEVPIYFVAAKAATGRILELVEAVTSAHVDKERMSTATGDLS